MSPSGGHFVMILKTGAKMHKGRVWKLPITESVIRAVESLAKSQGYTSLKLKGKNKTRLLPSDWDKEEEYIYDEDYEFKENDDEENKNIKQLDEFNNVDEDEVNDLNSDNNNDNAKAAEDGNVVDNVVENDNANEEEAIENNDEEQQPIVKTVTD